MFEHPITFLKNTSLIHATRIADSRLVVIVWMRDFGITRKDHLNGSLVRHSWYDAYNIRCKQTFTPSQAAYKPPASNTDEGVSTGRCSVEKRREWEYNFLDPRALVQAMAERIFQVFERLNRAEDYPGTGMGLALVRKAMQRMGGRVWAESALAQGATFYLEIPQE